MGSQRTPLAAPDLRLRPRDESPVMRYPALAYQADQSGRPPCTLRRARPDSASPIRQHHRHHGPTAPAHLTNHSPYQCSLSQAQPRIPAANRRQAVSSVSPLWVPIAARHCVLACQENSGHFHPPREAGTASTTDSVFARDTSPYLRKRALRVRAKTTAPFGGSKPSRYGVAEIAVTISPNEARRHRLTRFSLAIRPSS